MPTTQACALKFHFGLNVADLDGAVAFYRVLFNVDPITKLADYAKFDVDDPPVVLELNPTLRNPGGALNHVGFRVKNSEALVAVQHRLESAGIRTQREEGVECCYARQTKFWVPDADHNLWEVYTLEGDLADSGFGGDGQGTLPVQQAPTDPVVWEHVLPSSVPDRIPAEDDSLDEVRLRGTFNLDLAAERMQALLRDAARALRPGGRISAHALVSSRLCDGVPPLPGPAGLVRHVPCETDPHVALGAAGFVGLEFEKLGDLHCFHIDGVEFRELRLTGFKPHSQPASPTFSVLYRGPHTQVADERGQAFPRGRRVAVDEATYRLLREPRFVEQFTCFAQSTPPSVPISS